MNKQNKLQTLNSCQKNYPGRVRAGPRHFSSRPGKTFNVTIVDYGFKKKPTTYLIVLTPFLSSKSDDPESHTGTLS